MKPPARTSVGLALLTCGWLLAGCDQELPPSWGDASMDAVMDTVAADTTAADTVLPDTAVDTVVEDTAVDTAPDTVAAYPDGPYGWTPGMVWGATTGSWDPSVADVINNICLPSAAGTTVCLGDYYRSSTYQFVWVDFSAFGCPYCENAAIGEADFLTHLESYGYPSIWLTVIGTTPSEASSWATSFGLDPNTVLYDNAGWWSQGVVSGTPTVYLVHTSNMLIWDRADGWSAVSGTEWEEHKTWWADGSSGLIDMVKTQPGAIAP